MSPLSRCWVRFGEALTCRAVVFRRKKCNTKTLESLRDPSRSESKSFVPKRSLQCQGINYIQVYMIPCPHISIPGVVYQVYDMYANPPMLTYVPLQYSSTYIAVCFTILCILRNVVLQMYRRPRWLCRLSSCLLISNSGVQFSPSAHTRRDFLMHQS